MSQLVSLTGAYSEIRLGNSKYGSSNFLLFSLLSHFFSYFSLFLTFFFPSFKMEGGGAHVPFAPPRNTPLLHQIMLKRLIYTRISPISSNLTEIQCICKLDFGKVLWNGLYVIYVILLPFLVFLLGLYQFEISKYLVKYCILFYKNVTFRQFKILR